MVEEQLIDSSSKSQDCESVQFIGEDRTESSKMDDPVNVGIYAIHEKMGLKQHGASFGLRIRFASSSPGK